ncbi:MAG: biopolymer transporter ExbD [Terracidiphilus sp.]
MTMNDGASGGMSSEINVTPMIDVLLVLLVIFMLIVPLASNGESALIPRPAPNKGPVNGAVVLEVLKGSGGEASFRINRQSVSSEDLAARLAAIYADRAERVLFVKADDGLAFTQVAGAIDIAHAAGVDRIGLLTPKAETGY